MRHILAFPKGNIRGRGPLQLLGSLGVKTVRSLRYCNRSAPFNNGGIQGGLCSGWFCDSSPCPGLPTSYPPIHLPVLSPFPGPERTVACFSLLLSISPLIFLSSLLWDLMAFPHIHELLCGTCVLGWVQWSLSSKLGTDSIMPFQRNQHHKKTPGDKPRLAVAKTLICGLSGGRMSMCHVCHCCWLRMPVFFVSKPMASSLYPVPYSLVSYRHRPRKEESWSVTPKPGFYSWVKGP